MTDKYAESLRQYVSRSDEKIKLAAKVGDIIKKNNIESLLDIGAGEGTFASMIAAQVSRYVAAEKRKRNANALRDRGLQVIEKDFPFETDEKFDMVLASHSIPNDKAGLESFVEDLAKSANPNGVVCVITFKTDKDPWYELMRDVMKENWHGRNYDTYEMLFDVLKQYGDVSVEKIDTTVRGKTPKQLFTALRFIYAGKDSELAKLFNQHQSEVVSWIGTHRESKTGDGYEFPFFQYVVVLNKDGKHEKTNDQWARLMKHERHELKFGNATIVVEDGVFTPDAEITYSSSMILENLPPVEGKRIADVGTGTGVIAIISAIQGAKEVVATDVSDVAIKNAVENIEKNNLQDKVKIVNTSLLDDVEGTFDFIFANIPMLDEVWDERGIEVRSTAQKLLESAHSKLNESGKIYIPWGSFAEKGRPKLESLLVENGYEFTLRSKEHGGHTWYLYIAQLFTK